MESDKPARAEADDWQEVEQQIAVLIRAAQRPEVIRGGRRKGGIFSIPAEKYRHLAMVSATCGVGVKAQIAARAMAFEWVGQDLVARAVNEIVAHGAEPLTFLDYFDRGTLRSGEYLAVMKGIIAGCRGAGCALLGGEVAVFSHDLGDRPFELVGHTVGGVERDRLVDGSSIGIGQVVIGIMASGLHGSGFDQIHQWVFEQQILDLDATPAELAGATVKSALLQATRCFSRSILNLLRDFRVLGLVNIAEGGLLENIPRILPSKCQAVVHQGAWPKPPLFDYLQRVGQLSSDQMIRLFNLGLGMVAIVPPQDVDDVIDRLRSLGERAFRIGEIVRRDQEAVATRLV